MIVRSLLVSDVWQYPFWIDVKNAFFAGEHSEIVWMETPSSQVVSRHVKFFLSMLVCDLWSQTTSSPVMMLPLLHSKCIFNINFIYRILAYYSTFLV